MIVDDIDEVEWNDEFDIICVGPRSAALAAAVAADAAGLDVLLTDIRGGGDALTLAGRLGLTDDSADYLDCVTEDTGPLRDPTAPTELAVRLPDEPLWPELRDDVSFSGAALRDWAAACLASSAGLFCTTVADADSAKQWVGTIDTDGPVDIGTWLRDRTLDLDITVREQTSLGGLIFAAGQVVGAVIDTVQGPSLIRTLGGVVVPTGAGRQRSAVSSEDCEGAVDLVLLARPFSRFARLELLVS